MPLYEQNRRNILCLEPDINISGHPELQPDTHLKHFKILKESDENHTIKIIQFS